MKTQKEIISYYETGKNPTYQQFKDSWTSYRHKSEKIEQTAILGLNDALDNKANKDDVTLSLLYLPDVPAKADLYTTYPNPKNGEASLVLDEGYIYQFRTDINDWVKTPFKSFPDDIVTSEELQRETNQYKANIFDKNGLRFGKIINTTTRNIVDANINNTVAVTGFYLVPDWANQIFAYSHEGDFLPANLVVRFSKEPNDTGDALLLFLPKAETVGKPIPDEYKDYKYIAATVVRHSTAGFVPDLNNIFIGFSPNYKTDEIAKDIIPEPEKDTDLRFVSLDFNCFEVYKDDRSDVVTNYSDLMASQVYRAFVSLELRGFDRTKKYKVSLIRRNFGSLDYSIIIGSWDGASWVRDTYFSSTGVDIEVSNPNGINVFEKSLSDGRSIKAVIDYSYIPMNYSVFTDRSENAEPHYVIKEDCIYQLDENYATRQEAVKENDLTVASSTNKAEPKYIVNDKYVATNGYVYSGVGWKMFALPVSEGDVVTFGRFTIDSGGYSAFHNDKSELIQYNGAYTTGTLPKTVITPAGATVLYIDLARPANVADDIAELTINMGDTLLPYEKPSEIEKIKGYSIKADTSGIDNRLTDIQNSIDNLYNLLPENKINEQYRSKTALSLELSISDGSVIKSSYAYIDSVTKAITLK
ncbi:MAG: hypothetical protein ACK5KL_16680 [Dysgonomonas sp.]